MLREGIATISSELDEMATLPASWAAWTLEKQDELEGGFAQLEEVQTSTMLTGCQLLLCCSYCSDSQCLTSRFAGEWSPAQHTAV